MKDYTHYLDFGRGETLVLLPSNWLTSQSYKSIAQKLATKYRVIVPDLYRGSSKFRENALSVNDYCQKLHFLLRSLNVKSYYLMGISFSSLIAVQFIYQYPSELKKVILISPIACKPWLTGKKFTFLTGLIGYLELFFHNAISWKGTQINFSWLSDGFFNFLVKHPKQFFLDTIIATSQNKYSMTKIPVPTKILLANKDEFIPYKAFINIKWPENLETETVDGHHGWFFLDTELLINKILTYFAR